MVVIRFMHMKHWIFSLLSVYVLFLFSGCGVSRRGHSMVADLPYVHEGHDRQKGDLYLPKGEGLWPVVVTIHGGGWNGRDRSDMEKFGRRLARQGFAAYNIGYRLAPDHRHPAQLEDVRAALAHLTVLAERYPLDLDRVGLMGYSAGGHLALLAAATADDAIPTIRAVVAGGSPVKLTRYPKSPYIVDLIGGSPDEFEETWREASPVAHVTPDHPPTLLYHGRWDLLVEVEQSRMYHGALLEQGVDSTLVERRVFGHLATFLFDGPTMRRMVKFLNHALPSESQEEGHAL